MQNYRTHLQKFRLAPDISKREWSNAFFVYPLSKIEMWFRKVVAA